MNHAFNVEVATQYDVDTALFVSHLKHWTFKNLANKKHIHDGLCWSYDTLEALRDMFPYWSKKQLERVINNCVKRGLVVKGNYNAITYDRTCWYALTAQAYWFFPELTAEKYMKLLYSSISPNGEMEFAKWRNQFPQMETTIPDTDPDTDPNTNNISASSESPNIGYTESDGKEGKNAKSDYEVNQAKGEKNDSQVIEPEGNYTKSDYFENQTKNNTISKLSIPYGLKNLQEENIFSIPEQLIQDWITNRKKKRAPLTKTAWNKINKELAKCKEQGVEPIDAFEKMVAHGWQALDAEWFSKEKKGASSSQWDVDSVMRA